MSQPGEDWFAERGKVIDGGTPLDGSEVITVARKFDHEEGEMLWFAKVENDAGDFAYVVGGFSSCREAKDIATNWLRKRKEAQNEE